MPRGRIVIFMGSKRDLEFASRIESFIKEEGIPVSCTYEIASAHKTPEKLLEDLRKYEEKGEPAVYVTIAGLSDALSGIVAGHTKYPVIACPPDSEKYGWAKVFSSAMTPRGISVAFVPEPENAALAAVKILALSNPTLYESIDLCRQKAKQRVFKEAEEFG